MTNNTSTLFDCYEKPSNVATWALFCEGTLCIMIGICGLIGNTLTTYILCQPSFKDTFHRLLASLSVFDSLFISKNIIVIFVILYIFKNINYYFLYRGNYYFYFS